MKLKALVLSVMGLFSLLLGSVKSSYAAYTPLIVSSDFDGIRADATTTIAGILSVILIVVAGIIIARILSK